MIDAAPPLNQTIALAGLGLSRAALALSICISLTLVACTHFQKQSTAPPLVAAERRLVRAEKQNSDVGGQAGEFFAVAKIAEVQLSSSTQPDPAKSSAIALYNRATADLAADLPALIRQQQSSTILSLKDPQSGQINRLHLESGRGGEYPPTHFQKILIAERVDKKGMRDNATRTGLGGTVVGVHHSSAVGIPPARTDHGAMNHPKAVAEIRRIPIQQLGGGKSQNAVRKARQNFTRLQTTSRPLELAATHQ